MSQHPQHDTAVARGANCEKCSLYGNGQGPVMPIIRPGAKIAVVAESPGSAEIEEGVLLTGMSGDVLWRALADGGVMRGDCTATSTILCRPPGGNLFSFNVEQKRAHRKEEAKAKKAKQPLPVLHTPQECCAGRLKRDLDETGAQTLLGLGNEGLKAAAHYLKLPFDKAKAAPGTPRVSTIKRQHGSPVVSPSGVTLTASLHPGFALAGNNTYLPIIREDIQRAAQIATRKGAIQWSEPTFILKPSADVCVNVMLAMKEAGSRVTVDIETNSANVLTADIRCVGLGAVIDGKEVVIVVPIKHINGAAWWRPGDETRIKRVLTDLLETNPLAGHNLLFDTAVLLQHQLLLNRGKKWFDTMVAHHCTDHSELPHDLGFVAARFFEAPRWKEDADAKVVDNVDDYWLHLYCAKDVLGEMRLVGPVADRAMNLGVVNALQTDLDLAPVARDMGMLGLNINETTRRKYFDTLDKTSKVRREALCSVVGRSDFNPNATKQVSDFLFIQKKLTPPYATDGREWEELAGGDDDDDDTGVDTSDPEVILAKASTNELALLRLLDLGVDEQTRQFIETLLSYRGIEKCKGTYLGLKWVEDEQTKQMVLRDTHRARGFMQTESWGESRDLSILHASWKIHVTPTGRWATSPNVQNWPERVVYDTELFKKSENKDGIINTRAMVEAPAGHILVGADYAAIELRIYAAQAKDEMLVDAILNGKDPHTLNYATMMAKNPGEVMAWYERVMNSPAKVKKYLRMIAKRFCIAEGTPVLVNRRGTILEVPIETVERFDYVWDGLEWVSHDGVVDQGIKEVIEHDGLWATEDHKVWVEDGRILQHGEVAAAGLRLARTAVDGKPVRFVGDSDGAGTSGKVSLRGGCVPEMPHSEGSSVRQPEEWEVTGLSSLLSREGRRAEVAVLAIQRSVPTLHESEERWMGELRRSGDSVSLRFRAGSSAVGLDGIETGEDAATRQDQQRGPLRAGEPAFRVSATEQHEQTQHEATRRLDVQAGRVALRREARAQAAVCGLDARADHRAGAGVSDSQGERLAPNRRVVRVYDILNAGPRRRFTAAGCLVHNCFLVIYGGQRDKLYKTMAADRNPDGSRSFPDLQPKDVEMWFDNWHKGHPQTRKWQESVVRAWHEYGFVGTMLDNRRRFFIGGPDPTAMPNMTIQGSAASIMNRAMKRIAAECPYRGWSPMSGVILQVHDYVGLQVPLARQKEAEDLLNEAMPYEQDGMKYIVEQKSGLTWDQT